jgi:diacylglycerol kinase family enzyme
MQPTRTFIIYNPWSGGISRRPEEFRRAVARVEAGFGPIRMVPTEGPSTAGRLARQCANDGARLVIVAGGDGTINEAAQGMVGTGVAMAILPGGTANVLAVETRIGTNLEKAAAKLPEMTPFDVPVGVVRQAGTEPRKFLAMAGVGLDARLVKQVSSELKRKLGKLSYWLAGFGQVGRRLDEFEVRWESGSTVASFVLASRVRNYGGDLEIARHANLLDDDLALVIFEGPSSVRYLKYFSGVLLDKLEGMKGVRLARSRWVEVAPCTAKPAPVDLQIDGEYAGSGPARIEMAPECVRMLLPAPYLAAWSGSVQSVARTA